MKNWSWIVVINSEVTKNKKIKCFKFIIIKDWWRTLLVTMVFWLDSKLQSKDFNRKIHTSYMLFSLNSIQTFFLKLVKIENYRIENCQNWKLPKLKVVKNWKLIIENCQHWNLLLSCQNCQIYKLLKVVNLRSWSKVPLFLF